CMPGYEHDYHLEGERKYCEDTGIPCRSDRRWCSFRCEKEGQNRSNKCQQQRKHEWVGHYSLEQIHEKCCDSAEERLTVSLERFCDGGIGHRTSPGTSCKSKITVSAMPSPHHLHK